MNISPYQASQIDHPQVMAEKVAGTTNGDDAYGDTRKETGNLEPQIDPVKEKILLAKLDLFFVPIIMLVYLSCFLDRANIVR